MKREEGVDICFAFLQRKKEKGEIRSDRIHIKKHMPTDNPLSFSSLDLFAFCEWNEMQKYLSVLHKWKQYTCVYACMYVCLCDVCVCMNKYASLFLYLFGRRLELKNDEYFGLGLRYTTYIYTFCQCPPPRVKHYPQNVHDFSIKLNLLPLQNL